MSFIAGYLLGLSESGGGASDIINWFEDQEAAAYGNIVDLNDFQYRIVIGAFPKEVGQTVFSTYTIDPDETTVPYLTNFYGPYIQQYIGLYHNDKLIRLHQHENTNFRKYAYNYSVNFESVDNITTATVFKSSYVNTDLINSSCNVNCGYSDYQTDWGKPNTKHPIGAVLSGGYGLLTTTVYYDSQGGIINQETSNSGSSLNDYYILNVPGNPSEGFYSDLSESEYRDEMMAYVNALWEIDLPN